ncbi:MAG: hypothetical protein ACYTA5_10445 [Planctomycetota bacterium]
MGIVWRSRDKVLIRNGVQEGEQLVVSDLPAPVAGMKLRVASVPVEESDDDQLATEEGNRE